MKIIVWTCDPSGTATIVRNAVNGTESPACTSGKSSFQTVYVGSVELDSPPDAKQMVAHGGAGIIFGSGLLVSVFAVRVLNRAIRERL